MDYLCSAVISPEEEPVLIQRREIVTATPPLTESSCSESSNPDQSQRKESKRQGSKPTSRAGETSPSAICRQRKLSTAIATNHNSNHQILQGRPTVVLPNSVEQPTKRVNNTLNTEGGSKLSTPPKSAKKNSKKMAIPRSAPPKAPRSGPVLMDRRDRLSAAAIAPAPLTEETVKPRRLHRSNSSPSTEKDNTGKFRMEPPPLRLDAWSSPAAENFNVRGLNYMNDRIKQPSEASAFRLLTVDMVNCEKQLYGGMCAHPTQRVQLALKRELKTGVKELPPFIFAVNLVIPGAVMYHQVHYFAIDNMQEIEEQSTPFGRLMNQFMFGESDEFRNNSFKLIPRIVEGNYVVRKAVGSKPSILGKKIKQYYIRGERFFEIIVDIASDIVAQKIVRLALGYAKSLVVDMMYVIEGTGEDVLPERIFGGVRVKNVDFKNRDGKRTVKPPPLTS